jgi:anti-anti-sigma factor
MRDEGYGDVRNRVGTIMQVSGRVDTTTVSELRDRLHSAVDGGVGVIIVDLSEVELIDATGLAMLVGTHRRAMRAGRELVLRGTPARITRLLAATGLDRVLHCERPNPTAA